MEKDVNILVVDDEEIVRDSLCSWLKEDGLKAEAAEDGVYLLQSHHSGTRLEGIYQRRI